MVVPEKYAKFSCNIVSMKNIGVGIRVRVVISIYIVIKNCKKIVFSLLLHYGYWPQMSQIMWSYLHMLHELPVSSITIKYNHLI